MRYILAALAVAAVVLAVLGSVDDRLPCNAPGDVRYIGEQKYVCQETFSAGLRWTWQW